MTINPSPSSPQLLPVAAFDLIVFGATGDLALRKLFPALFHRWRDGQISSDTRVIGVSRADMESDDFKTIVLESYKRFYPNENVHEGEWTAFADGLHYVAINTVNPDADWGGLQELLAGADAKQRVFYLALPPSIYGVVSRNINAAGLKNENARIVLEKPIGSDLKSAREINAAVGAVFDESAIFRIDHYLGKETVQNLIVLRFLNSLFEPVWNANAIEHVEITVAESIGAGERASYYDTAGALRDMVQNHLLQLLCLVAMEPPLDLDADTVRSEKIKILRALRRIDTQTVRDKTVRGQYDAGVSDGAAVRGYADELGAPTSTETFVALQAHIDNWRWKGVPFYLRTGKRMSERRSEIIIQFKNVAHALVQGASEDLKPTRLVIRLQPDEGVKLLLVTKDPGPGGMRLRYVPLNLSYAEAFSAKYPDAYERLLMAVVRNDLALFMHRDEVEAAWRWIDGVQEAWLLDDTPVCSYPAGADGPMQAAMMLDRNGHQWFDGT